MTKVTFENATIRDVIGKAARVAPTSGTNFDKANGIVMEVNPEANQIVVRATNTEIFYMEVTDSVSMEGTRKTWRIPSAVIQGVCNKLPIKSGSTVEFDDDDSNTLVVKTGRMVAKMRLMDPNYYPTWTAFDPATLSPVDNFAARIQQVQWAASKNGTPPLTGVHLDGERMSATDQFKAAITPCVIEHLVEPVTIPASIFAPLMKHLGEVRLGQEQGMLLVMPDDSTQIKTVVFPDKFPLIHKVMKRDEPFSVTIRKTAVVEMVERAMVMGQRDRTPILKVILGWSEFAVMMEDQEIGLLGDVLDIPGQATHDRHMLGMTPDTFTDALNAAPNEEITFYYHFGMPMKPIRLDGGSGYEVLIMPRNLEKSADD